MLYPGTTSYEVNVEPGGSIGVVKQKFGDKSGYPTDQLTLWFAVPEGAHAKDTSYIHGKDDDEELRSTGCILKGPTADTIAALLVPCMPPIWLARWDWRRAASSRSQAAGHWSRCCLHPSVDVERQHAAGDQI